MKLLLPLLTLLFFISSAHAEESKRDWVMFYYTDPSPESFIEEVRKITDQGLLKKPNAQPPLTIFLSRVMSQNPKEIEHWLEEFEDVDDAQRQVLLSAAWHSDTDSARSYFKQHGLDKYLKQKAPKILEMEIDNPGTLDMLWGSFMATGDLKSIRRIVSALSLSKHSGALERFKTSKKTEQDKKEAYLDVTFRAARWSLESNCKQHPVVLKHCETIFAEQELPKAQRVWLGVVLSKVKPEKYKVKSEE